jgi:hypothetical protein
MATSFTEYNGIGFWSKDSVLTTTAAYIYREMVKYNEAAKLDWLSEMAADFRLKSYGYFIGFTVLPLDEFITIDERKAIFLDILSATQNSLSNKEEIMNLTELNEDVDDDGKQIWTDGTIKRERLQNTLNYLIRIIKGLPVETEPGF